MQTLALAQGDLVLSSGAYLTYTGADRIRQDLDLALNEAYGQDILHPFWGSTLGRLVGQPLTPDTKQAVLAEVQRVLSNYLRIQADQIAADSITGTLSSLTASDVVQAVESVDAQALADRLLITIVLRTMSNQTITIRRQVIA